MLGKKKNEERGGRRECEERLGFPRHWGDQFSRALAHSATYKRHTHTHTHTHLEYGDVGAVREGRAHGPPSEPTLNPNPGKRTQTHGDRKRRQTSTDTKERGHGGMRIHTQERGNGGMRRDIRTHTQTYTHLEYGDVGVVREGRAHGPPCICRIR